MIKNIFIVMVLLFLISCEKEKPKIDNYLIGTIEFKTKNYVKALTLFKKDFKETKNVKSLYRLAEISHIMGDIHNTEEYLMKAYKINKKDYYAINELALLHKRQGRLNVALRYFSKLTNQKDYIDSTFYHIIDIYIYNKKIAKAEILYKNNSKRIKNKDKINYIFFLDYFRDKNDKYKKYLDLILASKNKKILTKLLDTFIDSEEFDMDFKVAKIIEKDFPKNLKAIKTIGLIHLKRGEFKQSIVYFNKASKIAPDNIRNKINLAITYIYEDKIEEATKLLNEVISKKKNPEALLLRGFLFYLNKEFKKSTIVIDGVKKKIGETMFKKMTFNPLIEFYLINIAIDTEEFSNKNALLNVNIGDNQTLLALKIERINDLGLYDKSIELTKNIKITNQKLLEQLFIANLLLKNKEKALEILNSIKNRYPYQVWYDYFFFKKCDIEKGFEKYKKNIIYIDIYTDCLIRKQEFAKAKTVILDFVNNNMILNSNKKYLRKKILVINYNILKQ